MSRNKLFLSFVFALMSCMLLLACSSVAGGETIDEDDYYSSSRRPSSSSSRISSSSLSESPDIGDSLDVQDSVADSLNKENALKKLDSLVAFVSISKANLKRGSLVFSVEPFAISKTEVPQSLYKMVMGELPKMDKLGDSIAVANVNWYDAVLFCNALSKLVGLDTAYTYESIGESRYLKNLSTDFEIRAVRLPTEAEWELAYRGGTTTTYYWDTDVASKYAYYAQTKGPVSVGQYKPNALGLYDMGGNVAEWTNDWYDAYPTKNLDNYRGPSTGVYRVIRGGGWSDKVTALASAEREKKDPLYQSQMVGFRISVSR